jgi:hypothetical protein
MVLTKRQEMAQRLTRELQALGATVTNVPPLEEGKHLRFWCSDYKKNELLQQLKDAGYEVVFLGMAPQIDVKTYSMGLVNNFEVILPAETQSIARDDRIHGEIAKREERSHEVDAIVNEYFRVKR